MCISHELMRHDVAAMQVRSGLAASVWGYPFAPGPRATALFTSKRVRRHRTLTGLVTAAVADLQKERPGALGPLMSITWGLVGCRVGGYKG